MNYLQKNWQDHKDSRGQGVRDSSDLLKNYKELKIWKKIVKTLIKSLEKNTRTLESSYP